jgi:hypothetical protein
MSIQRDPKPVLSLNAVVLKLCDYALVLDREVGSKAAVLDSLFQRAFDSRWNMCTIYVYGIA